MAVCAQCQGSGQYFAPAEHVVVLLGAADAGGLHPHRGGEIGGAEAHRLQPRRGGGDLIDMGDAGGGLDDHLEA